MARLPRSSKRKGAHKSWFARFSPRALLQHLRWASVRRLVYRIARRIRLWRIARLPRIPLDDDLLELSGAVAGRVDDILGSMRRSAEPVVLDWFRSVEPRIRELSVTAFRLIGTAQELRNALTQMQGSLDPHRAIVGLRQDLAAETDPELQRFVLQTLRSEQRKTESLEQCRRNLRLIGVRLGAITSFLDSIYLRVPNVKVLADHQDWFAEIAGELENELHGIEDTFREFRQVAAQPPAAGAERPALGGWTVDLRRQRESD